MDASDATARVVSVGSLGGTITMVSPAGETGLQSRLGADDLLEGLSGLPEGVHIRSRTLRGVPSPSLSYGDMLDVIAWARDELQAGSSGAVVAQGTDTLEETAFLVDLLWDRSEPIVFTGAMRGASLVSADGPANLMSAIAVASAFEAADRGVLVVLDDMIHSARSVRKQHSTSLAAFESPGAAVIGGVVEGHPWFTGRRLRHAALPAPPAPARVFLLETHLDDDGELIRAAVKAGAEGLVVAAFGAGHVAVAVADAIEAAVARMPVIVASRTGAGGTLAATYGFSGAEIDLVARGTVMAGVLDPRKSRILLSLLLGGGADQQEIARQFSIRGRR